GGSGAAFVTTTAAGIVGASDPVAELTGCEGDCAKRCSGGEAGSGVLCKEGRKRANSPSRPTLRTPAKIRRRFTRSSEMSSSNLPLRESKQNSTSKRRESKGSGGAKIRSAPELHIPRVIIFGCV